MSTLKLYTEEQVKKAIAIGIQIGYSEEFNIDNFDMEVEDAVFFIPSIELPSDKEIENNAYTDRRVEDLEYHEQIGFERGALWLKEQILNQNK